MNWVDKAEAMGAIFEWKNSMSLERVSRSDKGTWPFSWAVTVSVTACKSGGRSAAFDGRVERDVVRICVVWRVVSAVVRVWGDISMQREYEVWLLRREPMNVGRQHGKSC